MRPVIVECAIHYYFFAATQVSGGGDSSVNFGPKITVRYVIRNCWLPET